MLQKALIVTAGQVCFTETGVLLGDVAALTSFCCTLAVCKEVVPSLSVDAAEGSC